MLTVQQTAELLGVTPYTVYTALSEKRLPHEEVFGRKVIKRVDAEAYKARTQVSGAKSKGRPVGSISRKAKKQDAADAQDKPTEH